MSHTFAQKFEVLGQSVALFLVRDLALESALLKPFLQLIELLLGHGFLLDYDLALVALESRLVEVLCLQLTFGRCDDDSLQLLRGLDILLCGYRGPNNYSWV